MFSTFSGFSVLILLIILLHFSKKTNTFFCTVILKWIKWYQLFHMVLYRNCLCSQEHLSINKSFNVPRGLFINVPNNVLIILHISIGWRFHFVHFTLNIFRQFFLCMDSIMVFLLYRIIRMLFWLWSIDGSNFQVLCRNLCLLLQLYCLHMS